ncbi:MAG: HD domain-containing phosphohydrolase [Candidatus Zixiibacteriota bacterium]
MPAPRLLVVDDEERVRKILNIQLNQAGYDVLIYSDPKEAIKDITEKDIDLVITDIRMPEVTGEDILQHTLNFKPDVEVIVLTGVVDVEMAVKFLRQGAFDYLIKPIKRNQLLLTVDRALDKRELKIEKKRLQQENIEYQLSLEEKVEQRTIALSQALEDLERYHLDTIKILSSAIELREEYNLQHSDRVRIMATRLAIVWGFSAERIKRLEYGALLHDIGKIAIPEKILYKDNILTPDEFDIIKQHPEIGARIVSQADYFQDIAPIIRWHHERYDGNGYPDGLYADQIPVQARIISVCDAFDAMTSDRPWRQSYSLERVLKALKTGRGKQFDPELVDLFIQHEIYKDTWSR